MAHSSNRSAGEVDALVGPNLPFCIHETRKYLPPSHPLFQDALAAARLGMVEAAHRYEATHDTRFITYAAGWIKKYVLDELGSHFAAVHVPVKPRVAVWRFRKHASTLAERTGRKPSAEELASSLGVPVSEVGRLQSIDALATTLSLDVSADGRNPSAYVPAGGELPGEALGRDSTSAYVRRLLDKLPPREGEVLRRRYGIGGDACGLKEIGDDWGVSKERVRQIEEKAHLSYARLLRREAQANGLLG